MLLDAPIKEVGRYEVDVSLTRNVKAQVTVEVQAEGGERRDSRSHRAEPG